MFCNGCGRQVPDGIKFCPGCGKNLEVKAEPVKAEKKEKKSLAELWKKPWVSLVAGILCGALVVGLIAGVLALGGAGKIEGAGYGSAQDAAKAYLQAMKAGDVNAMADAFAVESYVDNYDAEAYIDRFITYTPGAAAPIDPVNSYFRDAKIGVRVGDVHKIIENHYLVLTGLTEETKGVPVVVREGERFETGEELVEHYTKEDWLKNCAGMKIGKTQDMDDLWDTGMFGSSDTMKENYEETMKEMTKVFGCEKLEDVMVEITMDGEEYLVTLRTARYGGRWYVVDTNGMMAGMLGIPYMSYGIIEKDEVY